MWHETRSIKSPITLKNAVTMKHTEKSVLKIASRDKSTRDLQIKMNYHSATSRSIARSLPGINIDHGGTSPANTRITRFQTRDPGFHFPPALQSMRHRSVRKSSMLHGKKGEEERDREREKIAKFVSATINHEESRYKMDVKVGVWKIVGKNRDWIFRIEASGTWKARVDTVDRR